MNSNILAIINITITIGLIIYSYFSYWNNSAKFNNLSSQFTQIQHDLWESSKGVNDLKSIVENISVKGPTVTQDHQILEKTYPKKQDLSSLFLLSYSKDDSIVTCENCWDTLDDKYDLTWVVENEAWVSLLEKNAEWWWNRLGKKTIECNGFYWAWNYVYLKSFVTDGYTRVSNVIECNK
jgi:hypothetical protein